MPSLKDLKIRIASVKSTRKITKAMQMVAAAKLRRAQEAAEAARPYAERMEAVLGNLAAGVGRARRRRGSSAAPARPTSTSSSSPPPSAASAAASTPRSSASPAPTSSKLLAEGKTVKILTVGKKGREQLRRDYRQAPRRPRRPLGASSGSATPTPPAIAQDVLHRFDAGEFDVCTIFYNRFQSVISQIPTARQLIPAVFEAGDGGAGAHTSTSPTRRRSSPTCCRAASPPRSSPRCSRTPPPSRARA